MADEIPFDDEEILEEAARRFSDFFQVMRDWRDKELLDSYCVDEGRQWLPEDYDQYITDNITPYTINKTSPVIDSIAGFEIQNRTEVKYIPRLVNPEDAGFADVVENGVNWIENTSQSSFYNSQAFRDMLVCGIGATDTLVTYTHNDRGQADEERIFPGFLMYDPAARAKNMKDAGWLAKAKVVYEDSILDDEDDDENVYTGGSFSFCDQEFLNFFGVMNSKIALRVIYDYQWCALMDVWRIPNPFVGQQITQNPLFMNYAAAAEKTYGFNLDDSSFTFTKKKFRQFKESCAALGIPLAKPTKQKKYHYYRAVIKNGKISSKSENYSQMGYSIKVMTGKYSEIDQCYYGVVRAMKESQRLYNKSISDMQGFLNTVPKGGVIIESDAVDDIKGFIRTWVKSKLVTVVKPGAISKGKLLQKQAPNLPDAIPQMLSTMDNSMMQTAGVNPQFMGLMESKEMTAQLQGQLVRQALSTLAQYFDAKKFFTIDKGHLYIDCLRVLAENDPGRLVRNIVGKEGAKYIELFADDIAAEYDIEIEDTPETPDERQARFERLLEMAGLLAQKDVNILPLVVQDAPLPQDKIDQIMQAMQPPPPPQPDLVQEELVKSTTALQYANAEKNKADANKSQMDVLLKQKELADKPATDQQLVADRGLEVARLHLEEQKQADQKQLQEQKQRDDNKMAEEKLRSERIQMLTEQKLKRDTAFAQIALESIKAQAAQNTTANIDTAMPETLGFDMSAITELAKSIEQAVHAISQPKQVNISRDNKGNLQGEVRSL